MRPDPPALVFWCDWPYGRPVATAVTLLGVVFGNNGTVVDEASWDLGKMMSLLGFQILSLGFQPGEVLAGQSVTGLW